MVSGFVMSFRPCRETEEEYDKTDKRGR